MRQHLLELSRTMLPNFSVEVSRGENSSLLSDFELSMMCGAMVHPTASFSIDDDGEALSIEWTQDFPI
jgi:hypothetical protein